MQPWSTSASLHAQGTIPCTAPAVSAPHSGEKVALYNPRRDTWHEHFQWEDVSLVGLTPHGRATIAALAMNRVLILAIREEDAALGRHPPRATT
jgi:hypothetical protein